MNHGPLNQLELEFLARISVLEYLMAQLFAKQYQAQGFNIDQIKIENEQTKKFPAREVHPGFDPFQSDLITGEMKTALDDVFKMTEKIFERHSKEARPRSKENATIPPL